MSTDKNPSITFIGRRRHSIYTIYLSYIVSFGVVFIFSRLMLNFKILVESVSCSLEDADLVILKDQYGVNTLVEVDVIKIKFTLNLKRYIRNNRCKIIDTHYGRFIYDYVVDKYVYPQYKPIHNGRSFEEIYQDKILQMREEEMIDIYEKGVIFGRNVENIMIVSVYEIILQNIIEPYFLWEMASCILYVFIDYKIYLTIAVPIYLFMLSSSIINALKQRSDLLNTLRTKRVSVLRKGCFQKISEDLILPGDIIRINNTESFSCDAEIIKGDAIIDESFLTGEAIPVCKDVGDIIYSGTKIIRSSLSNESLKNFKIDKYVRVKNINNSSDPPINSRFSHELFSKDEVAIGIVLKTGKQTKKGTILRSFAARKPSTNEFEVKTMIVIKYLISSAMILCGIMVLYLLPRVPLSYNIEYTFDMAMTFFSPALYTCLKIGIQYSKRQLNRKNIKVSDSSRIVTAGEVDVVLFDKTGTLTELGVDITCFDTINEIHNEITTLNRTARIGLSTCHHVIELENRCSGDVLDMKMFLFSQSRIYNKDYKRFIEIEVENKYDLICNEYSVSEGHTTLIFNINDEKADNVQEYPEDVFEVVKIYEFDLYLKRLSVIVKDSDNNLFIFTKGAPDNVGKILIKKPKDYSDHCKKYGIKGFRVITVAYRKLDEFTGDRSKDEANLEFLGLLVFANKIKDESYDVIGQLKDANICTKMCTGDNILTAISVAKECGMIESSMPVLFPVMEEGCKSYYDAEWFCIANEDYIFDKYRMQLYYIYDRETSYDFVIAIESNEYLSFKGSAYQDLIMKQGVVFARFNPDLKKELVEEYSLNGFVSMFCGDGANDTGALSSADVGVSLANCDATIIASFNSLSVGSVLNIIKEGRSALAMSSAQFKYVLYSQILAGIQILVLLPFLSFPGDLSTLINDVMSCYVLGNALSLFKCSDTIVKDKFNPKIIEGALSIIFELFCIGVTYYMFIRAVAEDLILKHITMTSKRATFIYFSTTLLLITKTFKFADFRNFRENRIKNKTFLAHLAGCMLLFVIVSLGYYYRVDSIVSFFKFVYLSANEYKMMTINIIVTFLISQLPFDKLVKIIYS